MAAPHKKRVTCSTWLRSFTKLEIILTVLLLAIIASIIAVIILWANALLDECSSDSPSKTGSDHKPSSANNDTQTSNATFEPWNTEKRQIEGHNYDYLAALSKNRTEIACVLIVVSSTSLITTASCIRLVEEDIEDYRILEKILMNQNVEGHKIDMIIMHPESEKHEHDIAIVRSLKRLRTPEKSFSRMVSPRMALSLTMGDMLILLQWKISRDSSRIEAEGVPVFLVAEGLDWREIEDAQTGSPLTRGLALYAFISDIGKLTIIPNQIEWLRHLI